MVSRRTSAAESPIVEVVAKGKPPDPILKSVKQSDALVEDRMGLVQLGRLWSMLMEDRLLFFSGLFFLFTSAGVNSLTPIILGKAVAALPTVRDGAGLSTMRFWIGSILALKITASVLMGLRAWCMGTVDARMLTRLRDAVYRSVMRKDLGWHDEHEVGQLTSRVTADCASVSQSLTIHMNAFLRNAVPVIVGAVYLFRSSKWLAATLFLMMPPLTLLTRWYGGFTKSLAEQKTDATADLNEAAEEDFALIRVVRSLGLQSRQQERFEAKTMAVQAVDKQRYGAWALFLGISSAIAGVLGVTTLAVGVGMVISGGLTAEQLIVCWVYVKDVVDSWIDSMDHLTSLQQAAGKAKATFEIIDWDYEQPGVANCPDGYCKGLTIPPHLFHGHIEFRNVTFKYPNRDEPVIHDLSLDIPSGQTTAIVGASGCGKSTLLALVQQLYTVASGSLLLDGVPISDLDPDWLRNQMAVVTQEPRIFADTVFANIAIGAYTLGLQGAELESAVREAAHLANAHEFIAQLPQGYATKVGDMKLLSGGQRQRLAIARALIRRPQILILDEATSALDSHLEKAVQVAIERILAKGITCMMVAHRLMTVKDADQIIVMSAGRVVEIGEFNALLRRRGLFAELAHAQNLRVPSTVDDLESQLHEHSEMLR